MPRFERIPRENWPRAREMRKRPTAAERVLWKALRGKQVGTRFLRQHPIGPYIADFFSFDRRLVLEVDGDSHADPLQEGYDERRSEYFASQGIQVRRYSNRDVLSNLDGVLKDVLEAVDANRTAE